MEPTWSKGGEFPSFCTTNKEQTQKSIGVYSNAFYIVYQQKFD